VILYENAHRNLRIQNSIFALILYENAQKEKQETLTGEMKLGAILQKARKSAKQKRLRCFFIFFANLKLYRV
jgi:hypothetical protein